MVKKVLIDIHRYWFGELKSPTEMVPPEKMEMWFRPTVEIDNHIRDTFGKYLEAAKATEWDMSHLSREEQVALLLLLDQFPRHIYRESGQAFAYDAKAKTIADELIKGGFERFYPVERTFVFLPLEHSEDLADQDRSVWLFAGEAMLTPEPRKTGMRMALDYATKHRDIIRKFGRFPHRNVMLSRDSTPEELEFLKGGRGF